MWTRPSTRTADVVRSDDPFGDGVAVTRIVMGLFGLLVPRLSQRLTLLGSTADAQTRAWTRFWAVRDLALGTGHLTAPAAARGHLLRIGLLVDLGDTTFLSLMATRRDAPRGALAWLLLLSGGCAAADVAALRQEARR